MAMGPSQPFQVVREQVFFRYVGVSVDRKKLSCKRVNRLQNREVPKKPCILLMASSGQRWGRSLESHGACDSFDSSMRKRKTESAAVSPLRAQSGRGAVEMSTQFLTSKLARDPGPSFSWLLGGSRVQPSPGAHAVLGKSLLNSKSIL